MIKLGNAVKHRRSGQIMRIDRLFGEFATCVWQSNGTERRRIYPRADLEAVPVVQHPTLGVVCMQAEIKS